MGCCLDKKQEDEEIPIQKKEGANIKSVKRLGDDLISIKARYYFKPIPQDLPDLTSTAQA